MKAVGIVGYKKSGKTTLIIRLFQELSGMGYRVAVIKHAPDHIDFPETDTTKFKEHVPFVSVISKEETEIIIKGKKRIEDILGYFDCDIVLAEGFKGEKTFPKIVCLKKESDKEELFDGLQLLTAGFDGSVSDFAIEDDKDIKGMAAIVAERAFKLPNLNCGHCEYETCFDLAREIVAGRETIDKCVSLNPPISVDIDGAALPLNPFTSNLMKNTVLGMLSCLKGIKKGTVKIEIPE